MNKCFIGWDSREPIAAEVCKTSINLHSSNIETTFIKQDSLSEVYNRKDVNVSTEFAFTRFLVPFLSDYKGWALFCDCDFIFTEDLNQVFQLARDNFAVMCVQHDYTPKKQIKMDGQKQVSYPRKNWSSFVLWNCSHKSNRILTPALINEASPAFLHRFQWLNNDEIGSLPTNWNWLEGEYDIPQKLPSGIHFTNGGPWFLECQNVAYSDLWFYYKSKND